MTVSSLHASRRRERQARRTVTLITAVVATRWICADLAVVPPFVKVTNPVGVYGAKHDGRRLRTRKDGTEQRAARTLEEGRAAMGVDWMEWRELAESIPPAYTEWLAGQFDMTLEAVA